MCSRSVRNNYHTIVTTGGRHFDGLEATNLVDSVMFKYTLGMMIEPEKIVVCNGNAKGADELVKIWCHKNGIHFFSCEPLWHIYDRPAGPLRNEIMLDIMHPNLLVAFPGGTGTQGTIKLAKEKRIKVLKFDHYSLFG